MVVRVGTFIPFEASYCLNRHHFIERELLAAGVDIAKTTPPSCRLPTRKPYKRPPTAFRRS